MHTYTHGAYINNTRGPTSTHALRPVGQPYTAPASQKELAAREAQAAADAEREDTMKELEEVNRASAEAAAKREADSAAAATKAKEAEGAAKQREAEQAKLAADETAKRESEAEQAKLAAAEKDTQQKVKLAAEDAAKKEKEAEEAAKKKEQEDQAKVAAEDATKVENATQEDEVSDQHSTRMSMEIDEKSSAELAGMLRQDSKKRDPNADPNARCTQCNNKNKWCMCGQSVPSRVRTPSVSSRPGSISSEVQLQVSGLDGKSSSSDPVVDLGYDPGSSITEGGDETAGTVFYTKPVKPKLAPTMWEQERLDEQAGSDAFSSTLSAMADLTAEMQSAREAIVKQEEAELDAAADSLTSGG